MSDQPSEPQGLTIEVPTGYIHFGPLPDDHPFFSFIGRVAAEWARLEHILDMTIWDLSDGQSKIASCITSQLSGSFSRFNAIEALAVARGYDDAKLKEIISLAGRVNEAGKKRHRFVHDAWYLMEPNGATTQFRSIGGKKYNEFGYTLITKDDALSAIIEIRERTKEILALRDSLSPKPSWP